ncbi:tRNA (adenosine(37)-N6)-dimethylallyltransferase MiaA [Candidatus Babeliales bacterium]|nr:tRNA (adenosine(37)-N6)-dimethylallyltransferase MiaA [Candidatus Babeliales bacterium]
MATGKKKLIVITGPTASGKTGLSLRIAKHFPVEVINADSRQMWKPLTVGTAKPDLLNIPTIHHLFDVFDRPEELSVVKYRQMALESIEKIQSFYNIPLIVGGSMFYIKSFFFPPSPLGKEISQDAWQKVNSISAQLRWRELEIVDEARAYAICPKDLYRLDRALGIWFTHGIKPSECAPKFDDQFDPIIIFINPPIEVLRQRIHDRLLQMIGQSYDKNSWAYEVKSLLYTDWERFWNQHHVIGYPEIELWVKGHCPESEQAALVDSIYKQTVDYAKRQICFAKSFKKCLQKNNVQFLEVKEDDDERVALHLNQFLASGEPKRQQNYL